MISYSFQECCSSSTVPTTYAKYLLMPMSTLIRAEAEEPTGEEGTGEEHYDTGAERSGGRGRV